MNERGGLEILNIDSDTNMESQKKKNEEKNSEKSQGNSVKKGKKKRKKSFYKRGLIFYLVMLAVIFLGLVVMLWKALSNYQAGIDAENSTREYERNLKRAPQLCYQEYLNGMTEDDWVKLWYEKHPMHFDSEDEVRALIREHIEEASLSSWKSPEYTEENPVYLLRSGEDDLALFDLTGSGIDWQVTSVDLKLEGDYSGTIEVPAGSTVYCNGIALDEASAETSDGDVVEGYESDLVNPVSYRLYTVDGLLSEPELTADIQTDGYGIAIDNNGRYYLVVEASEDYKARAEAFIKSLLNYYTMGKNSISANMAATLGHVASSSNAASVIRASYDGVLWANYTAASYETWTSEVYLVADNCMAVDVYYYNRNEVSDTETKETLTQIYRVYFLDIGSGYKIYSFSLL